MSSSEIQVGRKYRVEKDYHGGLGVPTHLHSRYMQVGVVIEVEVGRPGVTLDFGGPDKSDTDWIYMWRLALVDDSAAAALFS